MQEIITNSEIRTPNYNKPLAFCAALCLFLSAIEYIIPKPLPFMRLGLANMPIILSLYFFKTRYVLLLVLLKILGQGFITGTFFSYIFLFSLSGSLCSAIFMIIIQRIGKKHVSAIGISIIGALANACSQIVLSDLILFENSAHLIAPILIISAVISGFLLGLFTNAFMQKSKWFKEVRNES